MPKKMYVVAVIMLLLSACGPSGQGPDESQVATLVAEAFATQSAADQPGAPTATPEAEAGGEEAEATAEKISVAGPYGACDNTELFTVAYVKDGDAWIWIEGGNSYALTNGGDVAGVQISDDGCRIAYMREVPNPAFDTDVDPFSSQAINELWAVNSDGSNNHVLVDSDFLFTLPLPADTTSPSIYQFVFQPGSHVVGFNTRVLTYGLLLFDDLRLVDANSGAMSVVREPGDGGDFSFSPDGSQIAFSTPTSMSIINTDGSNLRAEVISFPAVITYSEYQYRPPAHWSEAGDSIMVAVPPEDGLAPTDSGLPPETGLWYIPLDGTPPWEAGSVQAEWFALQEAQFALDNGRVAYLRHVGAADSNQRELVIALSNGSNESANIQGDAILFGDWAPDSNQFIYSTGTGNAVQLFLSDANGNSSPLVDLTGFPAAAAQVEWTDGPYYVQALQAGQSYELDWVNVDGIGIVLDTINNVEYGFSFDVAP